MEKTPYWLEFIAAALGDELSSLVKGVRIRRRVVVGDR